LRKHIDQKASKPGIFRVLFLLGFGFSGFVVFSNQFTLFTYGNSHSFKFAGHWADFALGRGAFHSGNHRGGYFRIFGQFGRSRLFLYNLW
jgi:hypothetical protein